MRVFAASDIHVDYQPSLEWVEGLSRQDYQQDLVLVAGDLSHKTALVQQTLASLQRSFSQVFFVPGNHDLWVKRQGDESSLEKFHRLQQRLTAQGIQQEAWYHPELSVVPLLSWYDYSFGTPDSQLEKAWMDFYRCRWPDGWSMAQVTAEFQRMNPLAQVRAGVPCITFSHFMPRIDLLPPMAVKHFGFLLPILGSTRLEQELRQHNPQVHLYGHSHVNVDKQINGVRYVNNARGYPKEPRYESKRLLQIF